MKQIRLYLSTLLIVWPMIVMSQKADFVIKNFRESMTDLSAATSDIKDLNGKSAALIRFSVRDPNFVIDANNGILKQEHKMGEIWVYVPVGTKRLDVRHPSLGIIRGYQIGMAIKSKCTYDADIVITNEKFMESLYAEDKTTPKEQNYPEESDAYNEGSSQKANRAKRTTRSTRYNRTKKSQSTSKENQDPWYSENYYSDEFYPYTEEGNQNVLNSGSSRKNKKTKKSKKKESWDQWYVIESHADDIYRNNNYGTNVPNQKTESEMSYELSSSKESDFHSSKKVRTQKTFDLYAGLGYNAVSAVGPSLHFGFGYMAGYLEVGYIWGTDKVEDVQLTRKSISLTEIYDYSCSKLWIRFGVNTINNRKFQISPQFGFSYNMIKGEKAQSFMTDYFQKSNSTSMFVGLRLSYNIVKGLHVQLTPQYDYTVLGGDVYPIIKEADSKIKSWGDGFGINIGIIYHF